MMEFLGPHLKAVIFSCTWPSFCCYDATEDRALCGNNEPPLSQLSKNTMESMILSAQQFTFTPTKMMNRYMKYELSIIFLTSFTKKMNCILVRANFILQKRASSSQVRSAC